MTIDPNVVRLAGGILVLVLIIANIWMWTPVIFHQDPVPTPDEVEKDKRWLASGKEVEEWK